MLRHINRVAMVAFAIVAPAPALAEQAPTFDSGNSLYAACTGSNLEMLQCLAYIEGFQAGTDTMALEMGRRAKVQASRFRLYCVPSGVTVGQYRDVIVNFLRGAAPIRHLPSNALVLTALERAFPCRTATPGK